MVIDKRLIRRIAEYAELEPGEIVLEVGCGTGNLTRELMKYGVKVIGIEKDLKYVSLLQKKFGYKIRKGLFELLHGDALKLEFPNFDKFVSNIPYSISSPLTFKLFKYDFKLAVVMYQREFAERLCGEDSRLGVVSKAYCRAEILEIVKPRAFKPKPKVESALVKIVPKPVIKVKNLELFLKFVTFSFSMKRKKMGKIVEEFRKRYGAQLDIDDELAKKRPEEVGAHGFARITNIQSS